MWFLVCLMLLLVPMEGSVSSSNASANGDHHQDIDLMDHHVGSDDGDIHDDHLNLLNSTSPVCLCFEKIIKMKCFVLQTDSLHAVFGGTHSEPVSRADSNAAEDLLHGHGHSSSCMFLFLVCLYFIVYSSLFKSFRLVRSNVFFTSCTSKKVCRCPKES